MRFSLFPSIPNSKRVRELRDFYWDVEVEGEELSIAFMGGKPLARIRAAWSLTSPRWMGDVLVLGDRGEFIIAVDRGLILSLDT